MHSERRKYRGADFAVHIGTSLDPITFYEIERLTQDLGVTRAEIVRRLVLRGIEEYRRDGKLPAFVAVSVDAHITSPEFKTDHLTGGDC